MQWLGEIDLHEKDVSILHPCWGELGRWIDEQQPLSSIGRAHSPELTNIYLSFSLPLPPLSEFILLSQPGYFTYSSASLELFLAHLVHFFISMIIIFLNLNASLCSVA